MLDGLIYVSGTIRVTYMEKIQVYLRKEELNALRKAAARSKRSVAALVREAVRKVILMPPSEGPVAIWDAARSNTIAFTTSRGPTGRASLRRQWGVDRSTAFLFHRTADP